MKTIWQCFRRERRGAVAVIFALMLVPLVLIIGLAVDFTFFTEARSQIQLAADAAATHAVRAATGTYALETSEGVLPATAQTDSEIAGALSGAQWFTAQLGQLPTAYVPASGNGGTNPKVTVTPTTTGTGFQASVSYQGIYPPFFDHLFNTSANWYIAGSSSASAEYSYVEIMMLLDVSQSMLIGADTSDILLMNDNTVCMNQNWVTSPVAGDSAMYNTGVIDSTKTAQYGAAFNDGGLLYQYLPADNDRVDMRSVNNYTNPSGTEDDTTGTCKTGYKVPGFAQGSSGVNGNSGGAGTPCSFACHNSSTYYQGYSKDLYGIARRLYASNGLKLRLDVVLQATEQVISSMLADEQATDQFSVGVYKFSTNVSEFATGTAGAGTGGGDANYEATFSLNNVLSIVEADDYTYTPGETAFPPVDTSDDGDTDFPTSMGNLIAGTYSNDDGTTGHAVTAVTTTGAGQTKTNPLKDIFIVTDGMNDTCCSYTRTMGEMTSIEGEKTGYGLAGVCAPLKKKGFTIYVLYVKYYPVPTITYYQPYTEGYLSSPSNAYINQDFPAIANRAEDDYNNDTTANGQTTPPDVQALTACASSSADFYEADQSSQIATAMTEMLKSALDSAITITN